MRPTGVRLGTDYKISGLAEELREIQQRKALGLPDKSEAKILNFE